MKDKKNADEQSSGGKKEKTGGFHAEMSQNIASGRAAVQHDYDTVWRLEFGV